MPPSTLENGLVAEFNDVHMVFAQKIKKPVQALKGMNLAIDRGSIVGLLGPNGCGKTTAVSCLTGLLFPQKGQVYLWGQRADKATAWHPEHGIGVVLEDTRLPPFMLVKAALTAVCRLRKIPSHQLAQEVDRITAITGIRSLLKLRINSLSKGQARKVGVAAALIGDPPFLVMDEPASGLDVSARVEFNNMIRNLRDGKRTLLITSHLLSDVENTCSHIAIMQSGRVDVFDETRRLIPSSDENGVDIFVNQKHVETLDQMGIAHTTSIYPMLVQLQHQDIPAYAILGQLAQQRIVPSRIEPRENLVSYYLSVTRNEA